MFELLTARVNLCEMWLSLIDIILGGTSSALPPNPIIVDDPEIYLHMAADKSDAHHYYIVDFVPDDVAKDEDSVRWGGTHSTGHSM